MQRTLQSMNFGCVKKCDVRRSTKRTHVLDACTLMFLMLARAFSPPATSGKCSCEKIIEPTSPVLPRRDKEIGALYRGGLQCFQLIQTDGILPSRRGYFKRHLVIYFLSYICLPVAYKDVTGYGGFTAATYGMR